MASLPSPTQVAGDNIRTFETWYRRLDPAGTGIIQAGPAAQFLKKSALDDDLLSKIWDLSDPHGKGFLDRTGLFVAVKLIALAQNKREPTISNIMVPLPAPNMGDAPPHPPPPKAVGPPHPPPAAQAAPRPVNPALWTISPADRARYDQIFNSLGPSANKIHGNKVRGVMLNSKLPMDILGKIWDLSDMDKDGSLDRAEFSIAMHLIYKALENNPLPVGGLPPEMISSARRGVSVGPLPAPLAPPSAVLQQQQAPQQQQQPGPPKAPWVVGVADRARYDVMFQNADIDKDGYVSGQEIKGIFLQSGLPQMVLAHIWNVCDMKQTGKLTSEQFALAMWLIQQKLAGKDPPAQLTSEMIPPSMRPDAGQPSNVVPAKPQYNNPELQAVADEIDDVNTEKLKLEAEIQQKEAAIRLKNNELKNLQTELDTLSATFKQLDHQKEVAQKRLDDLAAQGRTARDELTVLKGQVAAEEEEVAKLRVQVEEQEASLLEQEDEVLGKKRELDDLRKQETDLEQSVVDCNKRLDQLSDTHGRTLEQLTQLRAKVDGIADVELHLTEVLNQYESAIIASDASSLSEASLRDPQPEFATVPGYDEVDPTPRNTPSPPQQVSPTKTEPQQNGVGGPEHNDLASKAKDTSFVGGHDPFAAAFGGGPVQNDPFSSWDSKGSHPAVHNPAPNDPFGGDAFASAPSIDTPDAKSDNNLHVSSGPPPHPESPSPALPPKKGKQPPPRPAPPKKGPAHPPPPKMAATTNNVNSNNNPTTVDDAWGDTKVNSDNGGGFAEFANFADFDSKLSSSPGNFFSSAFSSSSKFDSVNDAKGRSSSSRASPWGAVDPFNVPAPKGASSSSSSSYKGSLDPFGAPFLPSSTLDASRNGRSSSAGGGKVTTTSSSPWLDDFTGNGNNVAGGAAGEVVDKYAALSSSSPFVGGGGAEAVKDAFGDSFSNSDSIFGGGSKSTLAGGGFSSSFDDGFGKSGGGAPFGAAGDAFGETSDSFGEASDSDMGGALTPAGDPFGTVDPFKDVSIVGDDKFSWEDEPDLFMVDSGVESSEMAAAGKKDPFFNVSFDANKNVIPGAEDSNGAGCRSGSSVETRNSDSSTAGAGVFGGNSFDGMMMSCSKTNNSLEVKSTTNPGIAWDGTPSAATGAVVRSKSVLADPIDKVLSTQTRLPVRSKTAMADPIIDLDSFDPLASKGDSPTKTAWLSNEDLINENFGGGAGKQPSFASKFSSNSAAFGFKDSGNFDGSNSNLKASGLGSKNAFNASSSFGNNSFGSVSSQNGVRTSGEFSFMADFGNLNVNNNLKTAGAPRSKNSSPFSGVAGLVTPSSGDISNNRLSAYKSSSSLSNRSSGGALSETEQLSWAAKESVRLEAESRRLENQEKADLERALALSASLAGPGNRLSS